MAQPKRLWTIHAMKEALGRSHGWVCSKIEELNLKPVDTRRHGKWLIPLYSERAFCCIKRCSTPLPDEGSISLAELIRFTGRSEGWVKHRLLEAGFKPQKRRSAATGRLEWFYEPRALPYLRSLKRLRPGGDWLTAGRISQKLGLCEDLVNSRLKRPAYTAASQMRLDDKGVPRRHYPPWVYRELERELEPYRICPPADNWLTCTQISGKVGRSEYWTGRALKRLGIAPELRRNAHGLALDHYPPTAVARLRRINRATAPSTWRTARELCLEFDIPRSELTSRLATITHRSRWYLTPETSQENRYYSPETRLKLAQSLTERPFDRLVDANEAIAALAAYQRHNGLSHSQVYRIIGSDVPHLSERKRVRQSLVTKIYALTAESEAVAA